MTAGPSAGPASAYPTLRRPASICLRGSNDVFVPCLIVVAPAGFALLACASAEPDTLSWAAAMVVDLFRHFISLQLHSSNNAITQCRRTARQLRYHVLPRRLICPPLLHEAPDELRNLIRCGIEREMTRIEDMEFGLRHVAAIGLRFRKLERQVVFAPEDQKPRLLLAHPSLPLGVGVDVRAVVVEEVTLNVGLAGLVEKGKFIGPEIRVIAFHVGIVPDMARARRRQRQEIGAKGAFVGSAIGPKGPPRLPIRP